MGGEGEPSKLDYASGDQVDPNRAHWSTVVLGTILVILVLLGILGIPLFVLLARFL